MAAIPVLTGVPKIVARVKDLGDTAGDAAALVVDLEARLAATDATKTERCALQGAVSAGIWVAMIDCWIFHRT